MMLSIHENSKDWFEFILDLDLLDKHFKEGQDNNDAFGNSLIIQFLYHANMTEQVYSNPIQAVAGNNNNNSTNAKSESGVNNLGESKCKRIKILRILAIKTACLLEWNLLKFEKDIPVAVMSDLLHIFLRYTMENDEQKIHSHLEIDKLDGFSVFALQLLHRWCIRIIVFSKHLKRPPNKSSIINVPGIVNPLQHMKDANENILKVLMNNVHESVGFLEKCLDTLSHDICLPTTDCFTNLSAETGGYDIVWEQARNYSINVVKCLISYDLGVYYFQQENYQGAMKNLSQADEFYKQSSEDLNHPYLSSYLIELKSYLLACRSMVEELAPMSDSTSRENLELKRAVDFARNPANEEANKDIVQLLQADNLTKKLSQSIRVGLEGKVNKLENPLLYEQICECNLMRMITDSSYFCSVNYEQKDLVKVAKVLNKDAKKLTAHSKNSVDAFLQLNFHKIGQAIDELSHLDVKKPTVNTQQQQPIDYSTLSFTSMEKSAAKRNELLFKKCLVQTNQSKEILRCLDENCVTIQSEKYRNKLRYFWSNWEPQAQPLLFLKGRKTLTNEILEKVFVSTELKDVQFYFISIAKLFELVRIKKFDAAYFILKGMESKGFKNGRFLSDMALFVNVSKISHELDFSKPRGNQKLKAAIEKKTQDAKEFFSLHKNIAEIPSTVCRVVLSFLVSVEEYEFLRNISLQDSVQIQSTAQNKKQRIDIPIKNANTALIEICKNISKLCLEIEKNERISSRKTAREIWDNVIEIFTDINPSKRSNAHQDPSSLNNPLIMNSYQANIQKESQNFLIREALRVFLLNLKNPLVSSLFISLLSTIYNIGEAMVNNEIFSEFRYLWPSSMANSNSLNINSVLDLLNYILTNYTIQINPFNSYGLRTTADIYFASANYYDAFKYYLQIFICETKFFGKRFEKTSEHVHLNEDFYEKTLKSMIKCCIQMNKHTHAALLSQMVDNNQDYLAIFRGLQDRTVLTLDEMDSTYECLWDVALLEFFTYIHASRGQIDKRNKCLKLVASKCINSANSAEIIERSVDFKKKQLFAHLMKYYITF